MATDRHIDISSGIDTGGTSSDHSRRDQIRDLRDPEAIRPAAERVNIYYTPAEQGVPKPGVQAQWAKDLAEGLEAINPAVNRFADKAHKEYTEQEIAKGHEERMRNADKWRELIRTGQIPEGASPWFRMGLYQAEGRALSAEYSAALGDSLSKSGVMDSDDSSAVQWHIESRMVSKCWTLRGLVTPAGFERLWDAEVRRIVRAA